MRVIPSDDKDFAYDINCLSVLTGGLIRYKRSDHKIVTALVRPGQVLNEGIKRIYATGTTARELHTDLIVPTFSQSVPYRVTGAPENLSPPYITGTPVVGETLTRVVGVYAGTVLHRDYQWYRDGTIIPGETGDTYEVVLDDLGTEITVGEVATGPGGVANEVRSAGIAIVSGTPPEVLSATVTDYTLTVAFSKAVTGHVGFALDSDGGDLVPTYVSGEGTDEYEFALSRVVLDDEIDYLAFVGVGTVEDLDGNVLETFANFYVLNASPIPSPTSLPALAPSYNVALMRANDLLWGNSGKTVQASADGALVRAGTDLWSGVDWTAPSDGARLVLCDEGDGRWSFASNGNTNYFKFSTGMLATLPITVVVAFVKTAGSFSAVFGAGYPNVICWDGSGDWCLINGNITLDGVNLPVGEWGVLTCVFNGAASSIALNNGTPVVTDAGTGAMITSMFSTFDRGEFGVNLLDGRISSITIYGAVLNAQQRADAYALAAASMPVSGTSGPLPPPPPPPPPPVPAQVYLDLADPDVDVVTIPPGTYSVDEILIIDRSDVELVGTDVILIPSESVTGAVSARTNVDTGGARNGSYHLTGVITEGTTTLTIDPEEPCPVQAGDRCILQPGVSFQDPNEAIGYHWMTVDSVVDGEIVFTTPIPVVPTVYASEEEFEIYTGPDQGLKIGPWNSVTPNGSKGRGLGTDHGLILFGPGGPITNVKFTDLHVEWEILRDPPNGGGTTGAAYVDGLTVTNMVVVNPVGHCLFTQACTNVDVDGITATGRGRALVYNTLTSPSFLVVGYGGTHHVYRNLSAVGQDMILTNLEVGCEDYLFSGVTLDVAVSEFTVYFPVHFGVYSDSLNCAFEDVVVNGDGFALFTLFSPPYTIDGLTITGDPIDYLIINGGDDPEFLSAPGQFGIPPGPWVQSTYQIANPTFTTVVPLKIYRSLRLRVVSGPAISAIVPQRGNSWTFDGDWWNPPDAIYSIVPIEAEYVKVLSLGIYTVTGTVGDCVLEFEEDAGGTATTVRLEGDALVYEDTAGTDAAENADLVANWSSGEGSFEFVQATSGSRPTYDSAAQGVVFAGDDNCLLCESTLSDAQGTLVVAFRTGATAFATRGDQVLFSTADAGAANRWLEFGIDGTGRVYLELNAAGSKRRAVGSTFLATDTFYTVAFAFNGTDYYCEVNDVEQNPFHFETFATPVGWFGDVTGADNLVVGGTVTSGGLQRPLEGVVHEVGTYITDITGGA